MKTAYRMFLRGTTYWCQNNQTGKQESLATKDKTQAQHLLHIKNQPHHLAGLNHQIGRAYLLGSDPQFATRTWQMVMDCIINKKDDGPTKIRWVTAAKSKSFDPIRHLILTDTKADDFLQVLGGKVSANVFLRRLHNYALDMNWLLTPVIAKRAWPKVEYGVKRAITKEEHERIIERERNPERKAFYELCWHTGGAQSDVANFLASDIDWNKKFLSFERFKNSNLAGISIGPKLETIIRALPATGYLFPHLAGVRASDRATEFKQRGVGVGITDVSLHCYRYSFAQRAKIAGVPERFAQSALGHGSKAVHRFYAKDGKVKMPSLEIYELKFAHDPLSSQSN